VANLGAIGGDGTTGATGGSLASGGSTPVSDTITKVQLVTGQSMYKFTPDVAVATFPTYARLLTDGFSIKRPSGVDRSSIEDGMANQRRRQSRVLVPISVMYQLDSQADYTSFLDWYYNEINSGADWFNWTDPLDKQSKLARIVQGTLNEEKPIDGVPNLGWRISMTIERWSRSV